MEKITHFQEFNPAFPRSLKLLDVSSNHLTSGTLMSSLREVDVLQCLRAKKNRLGGTGGDQAAAGSVWSRLEDLWKIYVDRFWDVFLVIYIDLWGIANNFMG